MSFLRVNFGIFSLYQIHHFWSISLKMKIKSFFNFCMHVWFRNAKKMRDSAIEMHLDVVVRKKRDRASRVSRAEEVSSRASTTAFSEGWLLYYRRAALNLRGPTPAIEPVMLLVGAFSRRGSREPLPAIIHYAYLRLLVADSCWRALSY